jgi:hypothetical protein
VAALAQMENHSKDITARMARLEAENATLREQNREIHPLRAELTAMRKAEAERKEPRLAPDNSGDLANPARVSKWLRSLQQLQSAIAASPENFIPEMALLKDKDWLEASSILREPVEDGLAKALAQLRTLAKGKYAMYLHRALQKYVQESNGKLPDNIHELAPWLDKRADPSALSRYGLVRSGTTNDVPPAETIILEKSKPSEFDTTFGISLSGAGYANPKSPGSDRTIGFSVDFDDLPPD